MPKPSLQFLKFGTGVWDASNRFETSWLLPPWLLCSVRFLISLYTFTVLFYILARNVALGHASTARLQFSYFTVLCYWGQAFYFFISFLRTLSYSISGATLLLSKLPRPLQALHYLFYSTITTFPLLITIVYWTVLYTRFDSTYEIWSNTSEHGLNSAFALFEILMTRIDPPPWIHLLWLCVILAAYLGLAYVTCATKGVYVYAFLNPASKKLDAEGNNVGGVGNLVGAYVVGIAAGICILFCVVKGLIWVRKWITEDRWGMEGKRTEAGIVEIELESQGRWEK